MESLGGVKVSWDLLGLELPTFKVLLHLLSLAFPLLQKLLSSDCILKFLPVVFDLLVGGE